MPEDHDAASHRITEDGAGIDINVPDEAKKDITRFIEFSNLIKNAYWGAKVNNSLTLDLFASYLKGQKILYIEAKTYCEQRLHLFMLPAIFISAASTVLSLGIQQYAFGNVLVASLTAIDSFLLAVINYMKLDAKAEAHKTSSYRFDKLQTKCEFYSGKVLFLDNVGNGDVTTKLNEFIESIEKQIDDIKDSNQFVIPEIIRYRYPNLYSANIFTEVKKVRNKEKVLRNQLLIVYNELEKKENDAELEATKKELLNRVVKIHEEYLKIDELMNKEIDVYVASMKKCRIGCFDCLKT
jgi:hypothetical protein